MIAEKASGSLDELSCITGKAKSNLSRTLRTMEGYGLVRLERGERGRITPKVMHECWSCRSRCRGEQAELEGRSGRRCGADAHASSFTHDSLLKAIAGLKKRNAAVLLQIAFDKVEHLALLPQMKAFADIVEIGTPLLKRFGVSAIATARELCPDVIVLADTKTVDGGRLEADMVFGAGAAFMTVLSCASRATHEAVSARAATFGATVVVDTITESGKPDPLPADVAFLEPFAYVALHSPTDARLAGEASVSHIEAVSRMHARGLRVSLAGGIGPATLDAVIAARPEIVVAGSAITEAANPKEVARWIRERLPEPGRGWPWDRK